MSQKLVYVACAMRDSKIDKILLDNIENLLIGMGYEAYIPALQDESTLSDIKIWKQNIGKISDSDFIIAEVTQKSHGVGFEVSYAFMNKKPVIALLKSKKKTKDVSPMISASPNVIILRYKDLEDLKEKLRSFKQQMYDLKIKECSKCNIDTVHLDNECYRCAISIIT